MTFANSSPCERPHRYGEWERKDAHDDRFKKPYPVIVRHCKHCPAFQIEGAK